MKLIKTNLMKTLITGLAVSLMVSTPAVADTDDQMALIDKLFAEKEFYPTSDDDLYDTLDADDTTTANFRFRSGYKYRVVAVCDSDCTDVDLSVYDKNEDEIDYDGSTSDIAILDFVPEYTGNHEVEVNMYECDTDYCYYRVRIYKGPRD